jgi:hypothetical protein
LKKREAVFKENDMVVIREIKKSGCVAKVLDGGNRLMVCIPPSKEWPFPHHVFVDREKVVKLGRVKTSSEETQFKEN